MLAGKMEFKQKHVEVYFFAFGWNRNRLVAKYGTRYYVYHTFSLHIP